ncbi:MAG: VWA domain-containing protein [Anaerolineae bacterium]|nr:VWA domain-containing protein [Anaerolineae bacterium]
MHIPSCLSPLLNRLRRPSHEPAPRGQVVVIFAVSLFVLLFFVGLAVDAGAVYVTYGQLKRAVDSAAVAAANDFKRGTEGMTMVERVALMSEASEEVLALHNVDMTTVDLDVFVCDLNGDGIRDTDLQTSAPQFYQRCPDTENMEAPRKLVWLAAQQQAPLYFLHLLGFNSITLRTNSIAEAAPVDLVIVIDVSESMASDTIGTLDPSYPDIAGYYDPDRTTADASHPVGCNVDNSCHPLYEAKEAAKALIATLYEGYDQVGLVTFDSIGVTHSIPNMLGTNVALSDDLDAASNAVDTILLHDDPPYNYLWPYWISSRIGNTPMFNPANPEDRDGDGADADPNLPPCYINPFHPMCCTLDSDRWDENVKFNYLGYGGFPCDDDFKFDAVDWDGDGSYSENDNVVGSAWITKNTRDPDGAGPQTAFAVPSLLSTCTGCGIRTASNILKQNGRPGAVWVIVFLSDGIVNLSDTPSTSGNIPVQYPNGFCTGPLGQSFWTTACIDYDFPDRYCIDDTATTCPSGTTWDGSVPNLSYSVLDYALDMTDEAALTHSTNLNEPPGNDLAIYSIGVGGGIGLGAGTVGEDLLRYMAAVGDDGDRTTDPCQLTPHREDCGQYYYAASGLDLLPIFEDIATRIYTRIAE